MATWTPKVDHVDTIGAADVNALQTLKTDKDTVEINVNDYATFSAAIDGIGATARTLLINKSCAVSANITVPANVTLRFLQGGSLAIANGVTVTINGHVEAGLYEIFDLVGTGSVVGLQGIVYPEWFGAKGDGSTDDTNAIQAAITGLTPKTSPPGFSGWGLGTIQFSTKNYLVNGTLSTTSPIGVNFVGQGEYATALIRTSDSGSMFSLQTYISVYFEKMAFIHDTVTSQATWTNILFDLNGSGGGRIFSLRHISTRKFGTIIKHENTVNEDTTQADHCTFIGFDTFVDCVNSQAILNSYRDCTWGGSCAQVFYVAGHQNTVIQTGNVVCDGPLIRFRNESGKYTNVSGFTLINTKFEWTSINEGSGSPPKIIDADGTYIAAVVRMIDCSLRGGSTPHADAQWASFGGGGVKFSAEGGELQGKIELVRRTNYIVDRGYYIRLKDVKLSERPDDWVFTDLGFSGSVYPPVSLENCMLDDYNPINLTMVGPPGSPAAYGIPYVMPRRTVVLGREDSAATTVTAGTTREIDLELFGQRAWLNAAWVFIRAGAASGVARYVDVYSDSARTNLIGTLDFPSTLLTNTMHEIPLYDIASGAGSGAVDKSFSTEGFFFDITVEAGGVTIMPIIIADFTSV